MKNESFGDEIIYKNTLVSEIRVNSETSVFTIDMEVIGVLP